MTWNALRDESMAPPLRMEEGLSHPTSYIRLIVTPRAAIASVFAWFLVVAGATSGCSESSRRPQTTRKQSVAVAVDPVVLSNALRNERQIRPNRIADEQAVSNRAHDDELILAELERRGQPIGARAVLASLHEMRAKFRTEEEFLEHVRERHGSVLSLLTSTRRAVARANLLDVACPAPLIDEQTLRSYYDAHLDEFTTPGGVSIVRAVASMPATASRTDRAATAANLEALRPTLSAMTTSEAPLALATEPNITIERHFISEAEISESYATFLERADVGDTSPVLIDGVDNIATSSIQIIGLTARRPRLVRAFSEVAQELRSSLIARERFSMWRALLEDLRTAGRQEGAQS